MRQLAPAELSRPPRRVRDPNVNGWLNFRKKQAKCYLGQGSSGGGLSRVPETISLGPNIYAKELGALRTFSKGAKKQL